MTQSTTQQIEQAVTFISYAREDQEFVFTLCEALKTHNVEPVGDWLLTPGQQYESRLRELNLMSQAFVFVISPDSIKSTACLNELATAVENKKQILPVSRRDHGDDNKLDSALRAPHWTMLREGDDFETGIKGLVNAVNTDFEMMQTHGRLLLAADNWNNNGRNRSYLLRKDGLKEAETWLAQTSAQPGKLPQPTPLQVEFIFSGRRARGRASRIAFGVVLAIALSLSALTIYAFAQRSLATTQAQIAKANEAEAKENAKRAVEVGKRRLMVATLLLNPEGTKFNSVSSFRRDLDFGVRPWSLKDGSLNSILRRFQAEQPETFVRILGGGDAAMAQRLLDYVATPAKDAVPLDNIMVSLDSKPSDKQPPEEMPVTDKEDWKYDPQIIKNWKRHTDRNLPEGNLNREPWLSRFKNAGQDPALQAIQLKEHTDMYLSFMDEMRVFAPEIKTERGVAFMLDLAFYRGTRMAKKIFAEAKQSGAGLNEPELLRHIAEISKNLTSYVLSTWTQKRHQMFLTTPFLSDKVLGF